MNLLGGRLNKAHSGFVSGDSGDGNNSDGDDSVNDGDDGDR